MKKYMFFAGLPRSGSTMIQSILNQNPDIHVSPDSLVCELMFETENLFLLSQSFSANSNIIGFNNIMSSIIKEYYKDIDSGYIIDKSFGWGTPSNLDLIKKYITSDIKIIVTVRDILEILASFIKLLNNTNFGDSFLDKQIQNSKMFSYRSLNDTRCDFLMMPGGNIDRAIYSIYNLLNTNHNICLIDYKDFIDNPKKNIEKIYKYIDAPYYEHNLDNIVNKNIIDDNIYGIPNMHKVKQSIEKNDYDVKEYLSDYVINKYNNLEFWKNV
jgi:sulfotransferase